MATHEGFMHVQDPSMPPAGASVTKGWIFVDEDGDTEPAGTRSGIQLRDESAGRDDPAPGGEAEPAEHPLSERRRARREVGREVRGEAVEAVSDGANDKAA